MSSTKLEKDPRLVKAEKLQAEADAVMQEFIKDRDAKLSNLHEILGFKTTAELVHALIPLTNGEVTLAVQSDAGKSATKGNRRGRPAGSGKKASAGKRGRRSQITDEMRAEVKKMVEAGKTGEEIAKAVKISLPSVQNIKKALGLVKARKK